MLLFLCLGIIAFYCTSPTRYMYISCDFLFIFLNLKLLFEIFFNCDPSLSPPLSSSKCLVLVLCWQTIRVTDRGERGEKKSGFLTILRTDLDLQKRQLYNEAEETRIGNLVVPYPPPHPEGEKMLMARAIFLSKDVKCCRICLHLIPIS